MSDETNLTNIITYQKVILPTITHIIYGDTSKLLKRNLRTNSRIKKVKKFQYRCLATLSTADRLH